MGYVRHHAIIVTSYNDTTIRNASDTAEKIGLTVTPVMGSIVNGYRSFMVCPDGSKERWAESDSGDSKREEFKFYLKKERSEKFLSLEWAEIFYGNDDGRAQVTDSAWINGGK